MSLTQDDVRDLPGADLVWEGLQHLLEGRLTTEALLVAIAAPRLIALGIPLPEELPNNPEHELWRLLGEQGPDVHSAFNALRRRVVSFQRALEHRVRRWREAAARSS